MASARRVWRNRRGKTQVIDVPWIGPSMNKIWAGVHWRKRKQYADEAHQAVLIAVKVARLTPIKGPVSLSFTPFHKGRHYDVSNYSLTCKAIEDGLVLCGILEGDSKQFVSRIAIECPVRQTAGAMNFMRVEIRLPECTRKDPGMLDKEA